MGEMIRMPHGEADCCEESCFGDAPVERHGYQFVGFGHGSFSQVNDMEFVGRGRGNYEKQQRTHVDGYRCRPLCAGIVTGVAILVTLSIVAATVIQSSASTMADSPGDPTGIFNHVTGVGAANGPSYDCSLGFENWQDAWTVKHQRWCCFLESRGCAEKVVHRDHFIHVVRHGDDMHGHFSHYFAGGDAAYDTQSQIYDCTMGIPSWQSLWSQSKKVWCCDHSHGEVMVPLRSYCCTSLHIGCQDGYHRNPMESSE